VRVYDWLCGRRSERGPRGLPSGVKDDDAQRDKQGEDVDPPQERDQAGGARHQSLPCAVVLSQFSAVLPAQRGDKFGGPP
jgi:hypothetical protein